MRYILGCLLTALLTSSAQAQTRVEQIQNYQDWGWESIVQANELITVATVPQIGARIMQFDLGDHASIFVNENETGKTYQPSENAPWHNYGGYKVWPAPQDRWGWPPPPNLDFGVYEASVEVNTADSTTVFVAGPIEQWQTPNLRLARRITLYRGSSRVRVEQTIINEGDAPDTWSVWDVTQQIVHHPGERDYENFWVYFPLNPESRYGASGVRSSDTSNAWTGAVAPGIYGVKFVPDNKKLFSDSLGGWISYVDEREGYTYAKTFPLFDDAPYPDEGARVEVWVNRDPLYLEVEVVSPLVEIAANGGRHTFVEEWWATKLNGPTLAVNRVGAVQHKLKSADGKLSGTFGVFHQGSAQIVYLGGDRDELAREREIDVSPLQTLALDEVVQIPEDAMRAEIHLSDQQGNHIGILDFVDFERSTEVRQGALPSEFHLQQSYPNPFNASVVIQFSLPGSRDIALEIFADNGQKINTLHQGVLPAGEHRFVWDGRNAKGVEVASGVYLYRLITEGGTLTKRMALIR